MNWMQTIEKTVTGLNYELVDVERAPGGLLRVYIDRVPGQTYASGEAFVTVDDCEVVTRQLQYVLEVENVDYARLEVSSPGLDRPLKKPEDFERFQGTEVAVTLKLPFQGRKKFKGVLHAADDVQHWQLVFDDGKGEQVLTFSLDEMREARLVPQLNFKGRRQAAPEAAGLTGADVVDGGQKQ